MESCTPCCFVDLRLACAHYDRLKIHSLQIASRAQQNSHLRKYAHLD